MQSREQLIEEIQRCREYTSPSDRTDMITSWSEEELFRGKVTDVFTVIFRTKGCYWSRKSGCSMCGYYTDTNPDINEEQLYDQLETALEKYGGEDVVKIFTSGSFLDKYEVPEDFAVEALSSFDSKKTVVESRPEFVDEDILKMYSKNTEQLEIAIGLESANDFILKNSINKGFQIKDYRKAVDTIFDNDILLRTYLLFKPPFLTENEAISDMIDSMEKVSHTDNIISINPVNVQRGSLVERLWRNGSYRPPWLWSLLTVLKNTDELDSMVVSSRAGLGSERGAHNCGECDEEIIDLISEFNLSQDTTKIENKLDSPSCSCQTEWNTEKELEPYLYFRGRAGILRDRYAGYV